MDAQETFGQLRSLLHLPAWSEETSSAFLALVEAFKKRHASFFRTQFGNGISDSVKRVLRKSQHVQDALYPIFS